MLPMHDSPDLAAMNAAVEQVMAQGDQPASFELTQPLWVHLAGLIGETAAALRDVIGRETHRPLFGCPARLVPGPHYGWWLTTEAGRRVEW